MFGLYDQVSPLSAIAALPVGLWELSLGVWLVVKGFKPSPITAGMTAAGTPDAYRDVTEGTAGPTKGPAVDLTAGQRALDARNGRHRIPRVSSQTKYRGRCRRSGRSGQSQ
jgi:hypothetical protein